MSRTGDFMIDKINEDYEKELDQIFLMGYQAYINGEKFEDCPYKVLPLKTVWEEGHIDASLMNEPVEEWNDFLDEELDHFQDEYRDDDYYDRF